MRSLNVALCGVLLQLRANATTIVALWTPDRILIAADSRASIGTSASVDTCKIGHSGRTWFAVAGLITDGASGYALGDSLKQALATSAGLSDKVDDRLIPAVSPQLTTAIAGIQKDSPEQFAEFATGRPILQAVLAETANGRPIMATVAFAIHNAGAVQPRASLIDGSDARGPEVDLRGAAGENQNLARRSPGLDRRRQRRARPEFGAVGSGREQSVGRRPCRRS